MLLLLAAFAVLPLALPWLVRRIGPRAFLVAALVPLAGFVQAAVMTPRVLAGEVPTESYVWVPQLGLELSMRMDTLGWLMALIVTGVGALVMIYCRWYFAGKKAGIDAITQVHANSKAADRNGLENQLSRKHMAVARTPVTTIGESLNK